MKENVTCKVSIYEGRVLGVELPAAVTLQVVDTEPPLKGATITNVSKPATTETGGVVQVPSFIEKGEHIEVDTRDGKYLGRGKAEE